MKLPLLFRLAALAALAASPAAGAKLEPISPDPQVLSLQTSFRALAKSIAPAVVSIQVELAGGQPMELYAEDPFEFFRRFFEDGEPREPREPRARPGRPFREPPSGLGSGVIVDPKGYILTNEHVVGEAQRIKVIVSHPKRREYAGKIVGRDALSDLAVVRIDGGEDLPAAALGDSSTVQVGDWAAAVGSPFGLDQTLTVGVISAVREAGVQIEGRSYTGFIQTDAAINRGNSGGPLLNIKGEVIGINTAIYAPAGGFVGVGFAIPSNSAKEIMAQLIARGRVVRGWLGVELLPLDDVMAGQFGVEGGDGALVNRVLEGSPAAKAGLRRGDVIVAVAGRPVKSSADVMAEVARLRPGRRARVTVIRDGDRRDVEVTLAERPSEVSDGPEGRAPSGGRPGRWEGAELRTASPELNRSLGLSPSARGALVTDLEPGAAADAGLRPGDLVAAVNGRPTPTAERFLKVMKDADLKKGVLFDVERGGRKLYLSYKRPA